MSELGHRNIYPKQEVIFSYIPYAFGKSILQDPGKKGCFYVNYFSHEAEVNGN